MDFTCKTRALSSLVKDMQKDKFSFDSPLQRQEDQWNRLQKSELIDSILRSYPLDPIRAIKTESGILDVIDGKQRATTIRQYISGEFTLSKNLENVTIDETEYEIAGKRFEKLDEAVQDKIKSYEIQIYTFTDCTDKDVREMFRRQNNGVPLKSLQKRAIKETPELTNIIFDLKSYPVFDKVMSPALKRKDADKETIRQVLMLSETGKDYDFGSFLTKDVENFIVMYNDNINYDKIELIKQALDRLNETFEEYEKYYIKPTTLPFVIYGAYRVIKDNKPFEKYSEWLLSFLDNYATNEEYLQYCNGGGTASSDKVHGRLDYFRNVVKEM